MRKLATKDELDCCDGASGGTLCEGEYLDIGTSCDGASGGICDQGE